MNVNALLASEGHSPREDAPLFAYAAYWMHMNQFLGGTDAQCFALFRESLGYKQYIETGTVPVEEMEEQ